MADRAKAALTPLGVKVEVLGLKELTKLGFGPMLGVAQGSAEPPRLVTLTYTPKSPIPGSPVIGLVGKGVTFDTVREKVLARLDSQEIERSR